MWMVSGISTSLQRHSLAFGSAAVEQANIFVERLDQTTWHRLMCLVVSGSFTGELNWVSIDGEYIREAQQFA